MSQDNQNMDNQPNDEVDLIRLMNYFKNGIKSFFRKIGNLFSYLFFLIYLLKKNWILTLSLIILGAAYGAFIKSMIDDPNEKKYEMIVKANPISNLELYAFGSEASNQKSIKANLNGEGMKFARELGITKIEIEPIERDEDVVNNYFEQVELNTLRGMETDTLFFKDFEMKSYKSKLAPTDYRLQRIKLKITGNKIAPSEIQDKLLNYLNNLPGVKTDQQSHLAILQNYESELKKSLTSMDSIMVARATANRNLTATGSEFMLNAATRNTVEADMMRYTEIFTKRLYGTQKLISYYQNGLNVVSNLRSVKDDKLVGNQTLRYALFGLMAAALIILGLRFNKWLNKYEGGKI